MMKTRENPHAAILLFLFFSSFFSFFPSPVSSRFPNTYLGDVAFHGFVWVSLYFQSKKGE